MSVRGIGIRTQLSTALAGLAATVERAVAFMAPRARQKGIEPGLPADALARRIRESNLPGEARLILVSCAGRNAVRGASVDAVREKPIRQQELPDALLDIHAVKQIALPPSPAGSANAKRPPANTPPRPLRILLAEDDRINRCCAIALLEKWGHAAQVAVNGHQAVDLVRREAFDLVLIDVQMPEPDGVDATCRIGTLEPPLRDILIIAMTAHAMAGARKEYLATGTNDYISKPILDEAVMAELADALPAASLRRLVRLFIDEAELQMTEIVTYRGRRDHAGMARAAHNLVSATGNLGALRASQAARELENACREHMPANGVPLIGRLSDDLHLSGDAMLAWLETHPPAQEAIPA